MTPVAANDPVQQSWRIIRRHRRKATWWVVLSLIGTAVFTILTPPKFHSEAKVLLRLGRENSLLDSTATGGQNATVVSAPQSREEEMNSVVEIMNSRWIAEEVVDHVGAERVLGTPLAKYFPKFMQASFTALDPTVDDLNPNSIATREELPQEDFLKSALKRVGIVPRTKREKAIDLFQKSLYVTVPRRTNVVTVAYDAETPELAQQVVQRVIQLYEQEHPAMFRTAGSEKFFAAQADSLKDRLENAEEKLLEARNATGIASIEDRRKIVEERMGRLRDEQLDADAETAALTAEVSMLSEFLEAMPETRVTESVAGRPNEAADLMRDRLFALELKEQELRARYKDDFFLVREIQRQVAEARAIFETMEDSRAEVTTALDKTRTELELVLKTGQTRLAALNARGAQLDEQYAGARKELEQLNDNALALAQQQRRIEIDEAHYLSYVKNLEQARIDRALQSERMSNISVVQQATLEPTPTSPRKGRNGLVGLAIALAGAVGISLVGETMNRQLISPHDVEKQLDMPVLAVLPRMVAAPPRSKVESRS